MRLGGFAHAISIVLCANLVGLYLSIPLVLREAESALLLALGIILCFLFLTVLTMIHIVLAARRGEVNIFVSDRRKRPRFFVLPLLSYTAATVVFGALGWRLLARFALCYLTVTATLLVLTFFTKVSVHVAGIAGPVTFMVVELGRSWALLYLLVPLVAWARLRMKAHTPAQLLLGALVAPLVTYLTLLIAS